MRRRLIVIAVAAAIVITGAIAVAETRDRGGTDDTSASPFQTRTVQAGDVTVKATLQRLDARGAVAEVVLDTHAGGLDLDVAAGAALTIGGITWPTENWEGDRPGGHHRKGELRFSPGGPVAGEATLTMSGLDDQVTFRWQIESR